MPRFRRRLHYQPTVPSPTTFFAHLRWIDGRKLTDVIEPYRAQLMERALYSFEPDGTPTYNLVLAGRGKKNWKSTDLALAALYRFLVWQSPLGNDSYLLANDARQAGDDLTLVKKLIRQNKVLDDEVSIQGKQIIRNDNRGALQVLPAGDVVGAHGLSYLFLGLDEVHGYRDWSLLEALALDPHRPDAMQFITSYASLFNSPGAPLHDLIAQGRKGDDPRLLLSWYAADFCTDKTHDKNSKDGEERANPSLGSFPKGRAYLDQQKRRLPTNKYRRLHLNLPGAPDGAFYDPGKIMAAIVPGRSRLLPKDGIQYVAFVDMSGGSNDDACLGIAHEADGKRILDCVMSQGHPPPFDPRMAVARFSKTLKRYRCSHVVGDAYAGETFRADFQEYGITFNRSGLSKSDLYEALEPELNANAVELLDLAKLQEQALTLVQRGRKVDHQAGDHDDWINAAAGALVHAAGKVEIDWNLYSAEEIGESDLAGFTEENWQPVNAFSIGNPQQDGGW